MKTVTKKCTNSLDSVHIDYNNYTPKWKRQITEEANENTTLNRIEDAFYYKSMFDVASLPFWGRLGNIFQA